MQEDEKFKLILGYIMSLRPGISEAVSFQKGGCGGWWDGEMTQFVNCVKMRT